MRGHEVNFICADDAHGTPIMQSAAARYHTGADDYEMSQEHQTDFAGFDISYDNYHSTHSDEPRAVGAYLHPPERERFY